MGFRLSFAVLALSWHCVTSAPTSLDKKEKRRAARGICALSTLKGRYDFISTGTADIFNNNDARTDDTGVSLSGDIYFNGKGRAFTNVVAIPLGGGPSIEYNLWQSYTVDGNCHGTIFGIVIQFVPTEENDNDKVRVVKTERWKLHIAPKGDTFVWTEFDTNPEKLLAFSGNMLRVCGGGTGGGCPEPPLFNEIPEPPESYYDSDIIIPSYYDPDDCSTALCKLQRDIEVEESSQDEVD